MVPSKTPQHHQCNLQHHQCNPSDFSFLQEVHNYVIEFSNTLLIEERKQIRRTKCSNKKCTELKGMPCKTLIRNSLHCESVFTP